MYIVTVTTFEGGVNKPGFVYSKKVSDRWEYFVTGEYKKARVFSELWRAKKARKSFPCDIFGINIAIEKKSDLDSIEEFL